VMWRNGEEFPVRAGDLIRNPPSGEHSLYNLGPEPLRIFVFEVSVNRSIKLTHSYPNLDLAGHG